MRRSRANSMPCSIPTCPTASRSNSCSTAAPAPLPRRSPEAVSYGVIKMNIDTDTQYAFTRAVAGHMFRDYDGVLKIDGEVGNKKQYDPRSWGREAEDSMAARVVEACEELGSAAAHSSSVRRGGACVRYRHSRWLFLQLLPRSGCFPFLSRAVFAISFSSRMVSAPFVCRSCNCILRGVIVDGFPCRSCSHVEGPAILWLLGVLLLHPRSHGCRIASSLLSFLQLLPHPGQIPASSVVVFAIAFAIAAIVRRLRACRRRRHACRPAGIGGCGQSHLTRRPGNRRFKSSC